MQKAMDRCTARDSAVNIVPKRNGVTPLISLTPDPAAIEFTPARTLRPSPMHHRSRFRREIKPVDRLGAVGIRLTAHDQTDVGFAVRSPLAVGTDCATLDVHR